MKHSSLTSRLKDLFERTVMPCAIGVAVMALGSSVRPLAAANAKSSALGCYDKGCNSHVQCVDAGCDLCHTDKRCGLIPGS